jgi:O-Antigen ligase
MRNVNTQGSSATELPVRVNRDRRSLAGTLLLIFLGLFGFAALLFVGLLLALAPQMMAKFTVLLALPAVLIIGSLSRTKQRLSDAFLDRWVSVLLATLALWPSYLLIKGGGMPAIDGRRIVVGVSLLMAIYFLVSREEVIRRMRDASGAISQGAWLVMLYAAWRFASCAESHVPLYSFIQVVWEVFYYASMYFIGYIFLSSDRARDRQHLTMLYLMVVIAGFVFLERLLGKNYIALLAPRSDDLASLINSMASARIRDGQYRTQGTFEHPLLLAEFSAIAVCFAAAYLLWPVKKGYVKSLAWAAMIGGLASAYMSGSRSAYISIATGLGAVGSLYLFGPKVGRLVKSQVFTRRFAILFLTFLGGLLFLSILPILAKGNSAGDEASSAGRLVMLETGLRAIEQSPIFGAGPGTGALVAGIRTRADMVTLDNYLLGMTLESGIPALILLVLFFLLPAWKGFLAVTQGAGEAAPFMAAVCGAALAVLATRFILWMPFNMSFIYLFAGVAMAQYEVLRHARGTK